MLFSEDTTEDDAWKFQTILKHEGPLSLQP
jgi:hypothetical protein